MEKTLRVELVTPEKLMVSEDATMVVVPGAEGEMGILAGHAPLISALQCGVVRTEGRSSGDEPLFVAGGFVEVTGERCTILAEEAVLVSALDEITAKKRLDDAEFLLSKDESPAARLKAANDQVVAKAMLRVIAGR